MDKKNDEELVIEADGSEELGEDESERALGKLAKLKKELEQVKKEKQEYLDGWHRSKADYVNALRRFEMEKAANFSLGLISAIKDFIPAMDSLRRAKEAGELPEGFASIAKQLEDATKK